MDLANPFRKKEPSQEDLIDKEHNFSREQNIVGAVTPSNAEDERIWLEQQKERSDLIKWQQNLEPELTKFYYDIKGFSNVGNEDNPTWAKVEGTKALANEQFLMKATALARPLLSKNLIMSNFTEDRILNNLKRVMESLRYDLMLNRTSYSIEKNDLSAVTSLFQEMIEAAYFRSLNDGERRHLGRIEKVIHATSDHPMPQKKGLFNLGG